MIRAINGLLWQVHSPSAMELLSTRDDANDPGARVFVRYDGREWLLQYWSPRGINVSVPFASKGEAIDQVAGMAC